MRRYILIAVLGFVALAAGTYLAVFGRALRQDAPHAAILFAVPKVLLMSRAVPLGNDIYLSPSADAFIDEMRRQGFVHTEQLGAGYLFLKDGQKYISTGRMYSSRFMLFSKPRLQEGRSDTQS
jgi:hypothetical protein